MITLLTALLTSDGLAGQVVQVVGAILILAGFAGVQARRLSPESWPYLWLNVVGSAILAVLAGLGRDWGFLLLEGVWALVSAWSIVRKLRGRSVPAAH